MNYKEVADSKIRLLKKEEATAQKVIPLVKVTKVKKREADLQ